MNFSSFWHKIAFSTHQNIIFTWKVLWGTVHRLQLRKTHFTKIPQKKSHLEVCERNFLPTCSMTTSANRPSPKNVKLVLSFVEICLSGAKQLHKHLAQWLLPSKAKCTQWKSAKTFTKWRERAPKEGFLLGNHGFGSREHSELKKVLKFVFKYARHDKAKICNK